MPYSNALFLEISKHSHILKMGIFRQEELGSTLKHYSQCAVSLAEIQRICQEITSLLNKPNSGNAQQDPAVLKSLVKAGTLLWDQLLTKPVKDKLKSAPVSDLILSIDEELVDIPWELLYNGNNFLCLAFNLGRSVQTKKTVLPPQYRSSPFILKMLILANPTDDLRSAYDEGLDIKNQFDRKRASVRIDFKSTHIDKIYVKKNLRDYDIVHFAGHGEYSLDSPETSGWLLSDGIFSVQDILSIGSTGTLPALVFSNACNSAPAGGNLVDNDYQERAYSLASAFLFSGVRHYVGAIRRIEDPVSLVFAREFYSRLIAGKSLGESLRLGRQRLIKEYGLASIHWGSYLLYGEPVFVLFKAPFKKSIFKPKIDIKKALRRSLVAAAIISISIYLYLWLPSINPSTYYLFLKSKGGFLAGRNQEVVTLAQRIIEHEPAFLSVYPLLADTYWRMGQGENAIKYYFAYALSSEKKSDKKNLASAYIGLGWIYHLQGKYDKALDFYNKALDLSRRNNDKSNEADVLGKLAIWYIDKQDYNKALELLTKSSEINRYRQHIYKHRYNLACDYFNLGLLFTDKDDFITAEEFYDKSFVLFQKLRLKYELSDYYFNIGEIHLFRKEYQEALECYMKGLKIDQVHGHKPNLAADYNMFGELYLEMDNLPEAQKYLQQAVSLSQEIGAQPELANAYYDLGVLYKKARKKNKASEYLRLSLQIYRSIDQSMYQQAKDALSELD
ncbi:MAG: tetratricopeptide repeat protein [Candidatus Omnitrophica bacterium]|nr:tetratricopeptide repeat protein [Candidatus Omnitrophota bacterium]